MHLGNRIARSGSRPGFRLVASGLAVALLSGLTMTGSARAASEVNPSATPAVAPATEGADASGPADGLLVRFDHTASAGAVERAVAAAGGRVEDIAGATGFVRVSTGSKPAAAVQAALAA